MLQLRHSVTAGDQTATASACFHCGLPIDPGSRHSMSIDGRREQFCCAGCAAAAAAIVGAGLEDYYRLREATTARPAEPTDPAAFQAYDDPAFQATFVESLPGGPREAALLLDGVRCSACIWLNEEVIRRLPGVETVTINYATRRARVRWDPARLRLSDILAAVARVGYRAHPYDRDRVHSLHQHERRQALWRLFVAGFGMMQVMMYAIPVYIASGEGGLPFDVESLMRWASLVLTTPVVLYSAQPFFTGAWRDLMRRRLGMDVPVALGVAVAFVASVWATLRGTGEVYFDSVAMFVFLLLGGRYLELEARHRAAASLEYLARLVPATAERLTRFPGPLEGEHVAVATLQRGDLVLVRTGERVPADGVIVHGIGALDEALLTGESRPQAKRVGSAVIGGSINVSGPLVLRVDRVGAGTVLASIVRLVDRAMGERHRLVALADRYAHWFVVAVLLIAVGTALGWAAVDPGRAVWIAVSVLVVTCPCALSLATPVALTVATGELARRGLVVTRGHAIETLARATDVVFDKTGTLTHGDLRVVGSHALGDASLARCLALARALEGGSEHPIARPIVRYATEAGAAVCEASAMVVHPGRGVEGVIDGVSCRIGSCTFCAEVAGAAAPKPEDGAATVVFLVTGGAWLARFELSDALKPGAAELVRALATIGKRVHLVSGDSAAAVGAAAERLGIAASVAEAGPADKQAYVSKLQQQGHVVAMVGDGINDAPVLAQADVSIAMGTGADLSQAEADAVLLSGEPFALVAAFETAGRAMRVVRQNLWWASLYNAAAIPAAVSGLVTPWIAGLGMSGSSLAVVLNALRLRRRSGG